MFRFAHLLPGLACMVFTVGALAQAKPERVDLGKREFEAKCASCHGVSGKGNGALAGFLTKSAADLTVLAKKNGGVLPMARMYDVIEGGTVASHGTRDMPVWGVEYRVQAAEYYNELPYDPQAYVRARILALIEYIKTL